MIFFKPKDSWSLLINVKKTLINNARDKESEENYDKVVGNIKEGKYYSLNGFSFVVRVINVEQKTCIINLHKYNYLLNEDDPFLIHVINTELTKLDVTFTLVHNWNKKKKAKLSEEDKKREFDKNHSEN